MSDGAPRGRRPRATAKPVEKQITLPAPEVELDQHRVPTVSDVLAGRYRFGRSE